MRRRGTHRNGGGSEPLIGSPLRPNGRLRRDPISFVEIDRQDQGSRFRICALRPSLQGRVSGVAFPKFPDPTDAR